MQLDNLSTEQISFILVSLHEKKLIVQRHDVVYALQRLPDGLLWSVDDGKQTYATDGTYCTCNGFECDHAYVVKYGGKDADWPDRKVRRRG